MSATSEQPKPISDKLAEFLANDPEMKEKYPHLTKDTEAVKNLFGGVETLLADMEEDCAHDAAKASK